MTTPETSVALERSRANLPQTSAMGNPPPAGAMGSCSAGRPGVDGARERASLPRPTPRARVRRSRSLRVGFLFVGCLVVLGSPVQPSTSGATPQPSPVRGTLLVGTVGEGRLGPGEVDRWKIGFKVEAPWRLRVVAAMERASLRLSSEDGIELWARETTFGFGWPHEIELPTESPGPRWLEIEAADAGAPVGGYSIEWIRGAVEGTARRAELIESQALARLEDEDSEARGEAAALLEEVLELRRRLGDRPGEVRALLTLAWALRGREAERTAELLAQALVAAKSLPESATRALVLDRLGHAHLGAGETEPALRSFAAAAELWARLGYPAGETRALGSGCTVRIRRGEWRAARVCLERVIPSAEALGLDRMTARLGISLGGVADHLGEPDVAIRAFRHSLESTRRFGDVLGEAQTLNNLAALHRRLGEPSRALDLYRRAFAGFEERENLRWQARTLNNLGYLFLDLDQAERARPLLDRALELRRAANDRGGEAVTLRNLARASAADGDNAAALTHADRALDLAQSLGSVRGEAAAFELLGVLQAKEGDLVAAHRAFDQAVARRSEIGDRRGLAWLTLRRHALVPRNPDAADPAAVVSEDLVSEDLVSADLVSADLAAEDLTRALASARSFRDVAAESAALVALAELDLDAGRPRQALGRLDEAIERVESVHTRIADPVQRASFLGARRRAFERALEARLALHRLEPGMGHHRVALEVSERSRARTLLESLTRPEITLEDLDPALAERWQRARRQLGAKIERRSRELARGAEGTSPHALDSEVEAARVELETVAQRIRERSPALAMVAPLDFVAIRALLDEHTGLLEISLGDRRSTAWWLTDRELVVVELPARKSLEALAEATHQQLRRLELTTRSSRGDAMRQLSDELLGPLAEVFDRRRIAVVADGALHAVPWVALPDPRDPADAPLLQRHEVVSLPSASVLAALRQRRPSPGLDDDRATSWSVAVLADPIFGLDDPRAPNAEAPTAEAPKFDRLPLTREEALRIGRRLGDRARLFLGLEAHRGQLLGGSLRDFGALHFASHGIVDPEFPELSGILLSTVDAEGRPRDGMLRPHDLLALPLEARLVVLSGCGTALGRPVSGEGFLGLAHGFLDLGVPRVVASLWPVTDRATAELMDRFYHQLTEPTTSVAEALHRAQRDLAATSDWRDPHYWAAFTLQGEWR